MTENSQATVAYVFLVIGLVGAAMFFAPLVFNISISGGGGALMALGGLAALTGFLTAFVFFTRSRIMAGIMSKDKLLVVWEDQSDPQQPFSVTVSSEGVLADDELFPFSDLSSQLAEVGLEPETDPKTLRLFVKTTRRTSHSLRKFFLTIPEGQVETARKVVLLLQKKFLSPS